MQTALKTLLVASFLSFSTYIQANEANNNQPGMTPHHPPKEAVEACKDKKEGDTCNFKNKMKENIEGTCKNGPQPDLPPACVPNNPPPAAEEGM